MPNLYPVLGADPTEDRGTSNEQLTSGFAASIDPLASSSRGSTELFRSQPATGSHEVIISAPEHVVSLAELSPERLAGAVQAWRERMRAHADSPYLHLIVNEGRLAGGSLEHTHAQLYALDFVPPEVARERERTVAYHERTMGAHLVEDVAAEEIRRRERLVAVDDEAVLVAPWASRSPFHLRLMPRAPTARFEDSEGGAAMLGTALRALGTALGGMPQLNLWIRTAPRGTEEFCWHLEILPRLTVRAGFELGTGVDINTYAPERAASDLREALG